MTNEQKEKLNKVEALKKQGISLNITCQLLGYNQREIESLQAESKIDLPDFMKDLFKGFDEKSDH